ncbi:MAG TPA: PHP domain-containing protein [Tepidisphaeraceae bacterium]|jgi:DNA polymerase (family 10)
MSLNTDLAELFESFAALMEIKGANVFKTLAFRKVARVVGELPYDIRTCIAAGTLCELEGVGEGSGKIIEEVARTGKSAEFEELAASVPAGLVPMLKIGGLGPKTISLLWKERGITSIEQLLEAIDSGKLAGLKGIGEKKIAAIKVGIAFRAQASGRVGIVDAAAVAEALAERLRKIKVVRRAEIAGSLRRRKETIGDVDIVCAVGEMSAGAAIAAEFVKFPEVDRVLGQGPSKSSIVTHGGMQVDLRIVPEENFGAALLYFTGSKEHNVKVRGLAQAKGMTLNEWGLYRVDAKVKKQRGGAGGVALHFGGQALTPSPGAPGEGGGEGGFSSIPGEMPPHPNPLPEYRERGSEAARQKEQLHPGAAAPTISAVASRTEGEIYAALGLAFIEPELREDRGEIEAAKERGKGGLPKLIQRSDVRGDLHAHTTASDGTGTIEEMAEAAKALGYEFLAITDHSRSQVIANGLTAERLIKHVDAIHKAGERIKGITLLAGCEVDILVDGRMDFEDEVLAELDIVIASPHTSLNQPAEKGTERILRAIDNRYVNVIGHPTGRLIDRRPGLPLEFGKIFARAVASATALEINSGYPRLDLNEINARAAAGAGVMLSINTDAHSPAEFEAMELGIGVARRGWVEKRNVINCLAMGELREFLAKKR